MAGGMLARRRLRSSLLALAALLVPVAAFVPSLPARARPPSRAVPVDVETSEDYEWYILQCYVGNEVWCAATIEEILGKPEHVYHKEKIIYPGYVFCRLRMEQELWRVLTRVPKIANFVGIDAGMRNGIGEIVEGYKGAVTPVPLSAREAQMMLSVHLEGQEVGEDNIVDRFALGDVVAVLDGRRGERGLVRSVKNDQLIVRLTGVGTASFDVPLDPDMVRHLTASELAQMEQAKEMEARGGARRGQSVAGRRDDDDYGAADAGLDARRSRRSDRREAARGAEADAAPEFRNRERSRWETLAAASERERSLLDGPDGSSYKVDAAFEQDDYENVDDDVAPVSADDEAFFDDLLGILDDPEGSEAAPAPAPAKKASHRDAETDDDALLRSLLSGGGGGGGAADDSFADFLGDDAAFDALFDDEPEPAGDLPAPRAGDDDDDDELLAILGLGPELPAPLPDEPLDLFEPAPPPAAPPAGNDYAKQTVPELKALLKARGLKVGGKKADLVDRLAEAAPPN
ncbi:transcription termination factor nusG [Aureococcus anophagefferens]|nr:transcription termination factor nusG [Aureococcus anophagefferens]